MTISTLIRIAISALLVGFGAFAAASHFALQEVKVNGPLYSQIIQDKDVVADTLPPPLYVVEAFFEVARLTRDVSRLPATRKRIGELKKEYTQRREYWSGQRLDPALVKLMDDAHAPAAKFWDGVEAQLLPAIERKNPAAIDAAYARVDAEFEIHRSKIELVVAEANRLTASAEARGRAQEQFWGYVIGFVTVATAALLFAIAAGLLRMVLRPLDRMRETMVALASGRTDINVYGLDRKDEIGAMAKTIDLFRLAAIERDDLEQKQLLSRAKEIERQKRLEVVVGSFKKDIQGVIETLNEQTVSIQDASVQLATVAGKATENAQSATQASNGASENAQAVAAASEELGASIREIASQAHRTSDLVTQTTAVTRKSNEDVAGLAEAAQKIGSIVEFIKTVAEQTNLLALNATIEAARAGEAGRGFAVVATEVKNLAAQTAKATSDISNQIQSIQSSTKLTVEAIGEITGRVDEITSLTCGIAAAVEEQDAATREIAQNVTSAAERSRTAAGSVREMQAGADQTRREADMMKNLSGALAEAAQHISSTFEKFLGDLTGDMDDRRKAVRHTFSAPVSVLSASGRFDTTAQDISLNGMRIVFVPGLVPGAHVKLDFGMGAVAAKCIWTNKQVAGMAFDKPLAALPDLADGEAARMKEAA